MDPGYAGNTKHGNERSLQRSYTQRDVEEAIGTAKTSGRLITKIGKYGTLQIHYLGTNGFTAVVETVGRNADKLITGWWRSE